MHKTRLVARLILLAILVSTGLVVGRAHESQSEAALSSAPIAGMAEPQIQNHVLDLVSRGLYEELDDGASAQIKEEIRVLVPKEARMFAYLICAIQLLGFPEGDSSFSDSVVPPHRQKHVLDLAGRAVYEGTPESVADEIETLSSDERRLLTDFVTAIQEICLSGKGASYLPDHHVRVIETLLSLAEAHGISIIDVPNVLSDAEIEAALLGGEKDSSIESCNPPWVSCNYIPFTGQTYRASCTSGCVTGSGVDTVTESASGCELIACDYRVWFSTAWPWRGIDGVTTTADCVADKWPHAHRYAGRTEDEFGFGTVRGCLIFSGDYLRKNMRVQP